TLTADDNQIIANPKGKTAGTVLEAELEKARGVLATLLVQNGTLKLGDVVLAGPAIGRIRAMFDEKGKPVKEAGPSTPVRIMGLDVMPNVGDFFSIYKNEREAREIAEERRQSHTLANMKGPRNLTMEDIFKQFEAGETKELRLILKVDVQGSLE